MLDRFRETLDEEFRIYEHEGNDKVVSLSEAVRQNVRPGMLLHFEHNHCIRANAILYEIIRQFRGKDPQFTAIIIGLGSNGVAFVHSGVVKKLITTAAGEGFPRPGPNYAFQRAYKNGRVEFENWSIFTLPLRLMAGAMGVGFMPTKSLIGSSMMDENVDDFKIIDDPFGGDQSVGVVKPLNPDITFIHGLAADQYGNTIMTPPSGENLYAPMASKFGAVVTAEKIVSTDFIRRYAHFVKLPGYLVRSVSEVPLGAHPYGISNLGIKELDVSYAEDNEFILKVREASKSDEALEEWMQKWVLDCSTHEDYIKKLGYKKVLFLKGKANSDSWKYELLDASDKLSIQDTANDTEWMIVIGARKIQQRSKDNHYKTILSGVGASNLAAWLAYYSLRNEGYSVDLMAEMGFFGYTPRPADPFIFNFRNIATCKMLSDIPTTIGLHTAGIHNQCIGLLGAAQVDKHGNLNSTKIPELKLYIIGSGGANDVASGARETMALVSLGKQRYVDRVSYITSPGSKVKTVVSNMGVFEKVNGSDELVLTGYFEKHDVVSKEEIVREIKNQCGWELRVVEPLEAFAPPNHKELQILRLCDPHGYFIG